MITYQILFHGFNLNVCVEGEMGSISGFYTARRVQADDSDGAYLAALNALKSEEKTKWLITESISNGSNPQFEAEEIFEVSLWKRIFGKCPKGFIFYADADENDFNQPNDMGKGQDGNPH